MDTGATGIYFEPTAPACDVNPQAPYIAVGTATGHVQRSTATAKLALSQLPSKFPRTGHVMPGFKHTLIGVGPICDANFSVLFNQDSVKNMTQKATCYSLAGENNLEPGFGV